MVKVYRKKILSAKSFEIFETFKRLLGFYDMTKHIRASFDLQNCIDVDAGNFLNYRSIPNKLVMSSASIISFNEIINAATSL